MLGWESMVWARPLEHFFEVPWSALYGLSAPLAVGSGHERVIAPLLLILSFGGTVGGAFAGALVLPRLAVGTVEDWLVVMSRSSLVVRGPLRPSL